MCWVFCQGDSDADATPKGFGEAAFRRQGGATGAGKLAVQLVPVVQQIVQWARRQTADRDGPGRNGDQEVFGRKPQDWARFASGWSDPGRFSKPPPSASRPPHRVEKTTSPLTRTRLSPRLSLKLSLPGPRTRPGTAPTRRPERWSEGNGFFADKRPGKWLACTTLLAWAGVHFSGQSPRRWRKAGADPAREWADARHRSWEPLRSSRIRVSAGVLLWRRASRQTAARHQLRPRHDPHARFGDDKVSLREGGRLWTDDQGTKGSRGWRSTLGKRMGAETPSDSEAPYRVSHQRVSRQHDH